jgi:hypothetical protein
MGKPHKGDYFNRVRDAVSNFKHTGNPCSNGRDNKAPWKKDYGVDSVPSSQVKDVPVEECRGLSGILSRVTSN